LIEINLYAFVAHVYQKSLFSFNGEGKVDAGFYVYPSILNQ